MEGWAVEGRAAIGNQWKVLFDGYEHINLLLSVSKNAFIMPNAETNQWATERQDYKLYLERLMSNSS